MKHATLRRLKVFESVARKLSFSRVAEEPHLNSTLRWAALCFALLAAGSARAAEIVLERSAVEKLVVLARVPPSPAPHRASRLA